MQILVFKTNLSDRRLVNEVEPHLENVGGILKWNVDLHDKDNILRIETEDVSPRRIEQQLQQAGYYCEELDD